MNSYAGMTIVKRQNDYFCQQSILYIFAYSKSSVSSTYVGWYKREKYVLLIEIIIFSFSHCHSYIVVHFFELFLLNVLCSSPGPQVNYSQLTNWL